MDCKTIKKIFYGNGLSFSECQRCIRKLYIDKSFNKILYIKNKLTEVPMFISEKTLLIYIFNYTIQIQNITNITKTCQNFLCFINKEMNKDFPISSFDDVYISNEYKRKDIYTVQSELYTSKYKFNKPFSAAKNIFGNSYYEIMYFLYKDKHVLSFEEYFFFLCNMAVRMPVDYNMLKKVHIKIR